MNLTKPLVDYWVCRFCGTNYGPDQVECVHADCREKEEAAERDQDAEDYARQEGRLIIEERLAVARQPRASTGNTKHL